jgi:hypothetical protein
MSGTVVELDPPPEGTLTPRMKQLRGWIRESFPDRQVDSWYEFDQRQEHYGMHGYDRSLRIRKIKFRFERSQDAVLFKLAHGGK